GEVEDVRRGLEDAGRSQLRPGEVEALDLIRDLNEPTGVHAVIGRIEDASVRQQLLRAGVRQLVVRPAADDLGSQPGDGGVVQRATHGAGGVDVDVGPDQRGRVGDYLNLGM